MKKGLDVRGILNDAFSAVGVSWYIKGILDSKKQLYTLTDDTKLISKVFELISIPIIIQALEPHITSWETEKRQNVYPDLTLTLDGVSSRKIAVDIKSTYRRGIYAGFTLGSYTAYIRSPYTKNIRYPYTDYREHWIVGFIYDRVPGIEPDIVNISEIDRIKAPIENVEVVIWQKWQLASDTPGSGNTANIGSVRTVEALRNGHGSFVIFGKKGEEIFEDYWRNFDWRTPRKYNNLKGYLSWKKGLNK